MKIVFFDVKPWEEEYLKRKLSKHSLKFFEESLDNSNISKIKDCQAISVFIYSKIDSKILNKLPKLKIITTRSTGFDHVDIKECKKRKIIVCNVPFYGENTVAEHTFGLILALSRHIHKLYVRTLKDDFSIDGMTGFDLKGKTIGVVGAGHIGVHVIRIAKGFEMGVLVYDVNKDSKLSKKFGFKYVGLNELLKKSDIVSLHVPYNKHTRHLINKKNIKLMKKGAILINTSRGGLIDTNVLLFALENKILGGAGLDVIEGEDLIKEEKQLLHETGNVAKWRTIVRNHKIFRMENVVFTPHNAFNSREALIRILDTTIDNIKSFSGKKPLNIVK